MYLKESIEIREMAQDLGVLEDFTEGPVRFLVLTSKVHR